MKTPGTVGAHPATAWRIDDGVVDLRRGAGREREGWEVSAEPQSLVLDPARTALVVVDMQNDFCHPDGWLGSIGVDVSAARRPIEPLQRLLGPWRATGAPVIWLNWGTRPDRANLPSGVLHVYDPDGHSTGIGEELPGAGAVLQAGSWNAAVVDELEVAAGDISIDKHRMSGFWDTPLDSVLRNLDVTTLLFAGVNADQCVLATLIDAACAGYDVAMLTDCSATTSPDFCWEATVYNVKQCFGFVAESTAVLEGITA
ncbi:isochorismatase family protein [Nocardioides sp. zg-ZUI104]|uniref:cysteine hydrolase family protein n=1 Tax=Nocardioides faecalis TaxID=2803858 RepID=UPI001BD1817A|nr:cysteine hydrolase family protein [Nocardioides faecalis]MBS4753134.1 isochorismatase family protein [Nocardioides faecalis]